MTPREPQVKGVAFRGTLKAIDRICPAGTIDQMSALLPNEIAGAVKHGGFITSGWYPLAHYRAIFGAAMQVTGRGTELISELSRESTNDDFRGIYRLLTFVLSPEGLMRRAPGLFNRYYDTGTLTVPEARPGHCRALWTGCVGFDRVLWEDVLAGARGILEVCGAKELQIKPVRGGGDGDEELELVATWR